MQSTQAFKQSRSGGLPLRGIAITLLVLLAVGAVAGGVALMLGPQGQIIPLDVALLTGSPFAGYLVPGMILAGGLGIGSLLIWLAVQIAIIGYSNEPPLQAIYLGAWRRDRLGRNIGPRPARSRDAHGGSEPPMNGAQVVLGERGSGLDRGRGVDHELCPTVEDRAFRIPAIAEGAR